MNPFVLMTMLLAAQTSQRRCNNRPQSPAALRPVFRDFRLTRDTLTKRQKHRLLVIRGAVVSVLMITFIIGLIAF